jgi:hypothetical protein
VCVVCVYVCCVCLGAFDYKETWRGRWAVALCDPHTHHTARTITNVPQKQRSSERVMAVCAGWVSWGWVAWLPD